ncbi:hypothetical protein PIB30_110453, partial [Stylosanthes scabra]|nr:hypothetical protein [Stylosanthes scabra]
MRGHKSTTQQSSRICVNSIGPLTHMRESQRKLFFLFSICLGTSKPFKFGVVPFILIHYINMAPKIQRLVSMERRKLGKPETKRILMKNKK